MARLFYVCLISSKQFILNGCISDWAGRLVRCHYIYVFVSYFLSRMIVFLIAHYESKKTANENLYVRITIPLHQTERV